MRLAGGRSVSGYDKRWTEIGKHMDPHVAIAGGTRMLVRILALGYLPCILSQRASGNCLQPQNVAIDGGLFDVDSIQPLHKVLDEREFRETYFTSLIFLPRPYRASFSRASSIPPTRLGAARQSAHPAARLTAAGQRAAPGGFTPRCSATIPQIRKTRNFRRGI